MRKLTAAVLTVAAALAVLLGLSSTATAGNAAGPLAIRPCQVLRTLPAYTYTEQGARVSEPTGPARYREAVADGARGDRLQLACRAMATQQVRKGGAPSATLTVLREIGIR